jgi:hypothetical protein
MSIKDTLKTRGKTHGDFKENANLSQRLKHTIRLQSTIALSAAQLEALDAICAKIARICTGDPNHADSWHDIAGYSQLIEYIISKEKAS